MRESTRCDKKYDSHPHECEKEVPSYNKACISSSNPAAIFKPSVFGRTRLIIHRLHCHTDSYRNYSVYRNPNRDNIQFKRPRLLRVSSDIDKDLIYRFGLCSSDMIIPVEERVEKDKCHYQYHCRKNE